jgi:hypothetical protein
MLKSAVSPTPNTTTVVAPTARNPKRLTSTILDHLEWLIFQAPRIPAQDRASATRRSVMVAEVLLDRPTGHPVTLDHGGSTGPSGRSRTGRIQASIRSDPGRIASDLARCGGSGRAGWSRNWGLRTG